MKTRVGISGSGYIGRGLINVLDGRDDFEVSAVLTRTNPQRRADFPRPGLMTRSLATLVERSDLVIECSGDVVHATDVVDGALAAGLPVVTMNAEMQVTTGSYFVGKGLFTEAEGDQPGCLAALAEEVVEMGFVPLVYGNMKGFLNHTPTPDEMDYWGKRQGLTLQRVVSFTDGTKLQVEQALVANGMGATIATDGLLGLRVGKLEDATDRLVAAATDAGRPIADYVLSSALPPGVFIIGTHTQYEVQRMYLRNYKLGEGPAYVLLRPYHLCHLEIVKTLKRVVTRGGRFLDNSETPTVSVAAVAKHGLKPGLRLSHGIGSFDVRGIAVRWEAHSEHCPIGLMQNATVTRSIDEGQVIGLADVELPDTLALRAWTAIRDGVRSSWPRRG